MVTEQTIKQIGTQILTEAKKHIPGIHTEGGRRNALFDLCMKDKDAATQIFRFMDVFPSLNDDKILSHMREYLIDSNVNLGVLAPLVKATKIAPDTAIKTIKTFSHGMAKSFIAGNTIAEGAQAIKGFKDGRGATFDIVGEITTSEVDARKYQQAYLAALDTLAGVYGKDALDKFGKPKINLSVKLSALDEHFDPIDPDGTSKRVRERLRPLFRKAKEIGAFINLDMEHFQYNAVTNKIFKELLMEEEFKDFVHAGAVVQGYLKSSEAILDDLIAFAKKRGTPITIRLVKGAYWDHEVMLAGKNNWDVPVFIDKRDTDANYEKLARKLLENIEHTRAAFGSHNARTIAVALAHVEELGVDKKLWEIQKLYGVAEEVGTALEKMDVPLRDYVPCGELVPAMGYFVRRLLENSSNEAFVRGLSKDLDIDALLKDPSVKDDVVESDNSEKIKKSEKKGWFKKLLSGSNDREVEVESVTTHHEVSGVINNHGFVNHPAGNFAEEIILSGMQDAVANFKIGDLHHGLKIGSEWVDTEEYIESISPSTKEVLGNVAKGGKKEIQDAIGAAADAFESWKNVSAKERSEYLFKAAKLMSDKIFYLSALIVHENAKPWKEAYADVEEAIDFLNYYAHQMVILDEELLTQDIPGEENTTFYQPLGVTAVIAPWNFPLAILTGMTSAAIVTGNTVVMKPASDTPLIAAELVKLFEEAGLPDGVLNFVPCPGKLAEQMITSDVTKMVVFTGSEEVGAHIYKTIAQTSEHYFKNLIIETGGKNAIIVDESADPEQAVIGVVKSAFGFSGQKCSACSRVVVDEQIYDLFVEKLVNAVKSVRVGQSVDPGVDMSAVINEAAYDKMISLIEQSVKEGGKLLVTGDHSKENGFYVHPTIVEITEHNVLAQEEVFGPVLAVMKAKDFTDALRIANQTRFALTGGLYSRTPSHIEQSKRDFEVGNLYVNRACTGAIVGRQHFGGFKKSGLGSKAGGPDYLPRFMKRVVRTVNQDRNGHIPNILDYVRK